MFLMNSAEARERQMFSGRENCCRIPPADNTLEEREYCGEKQEETVDSKQRPCV